MVRHPSVVRKKGNITITNDPAKDKLKLDIRTASYEDLYQEWSTQETDRWYRTEGMYNTIVKYFEQLK